MNADRKQRPARRRPDHAVAVIDQMTGARAGHIGNLSLTGMMLISERPIVDDGVYQFAFTLPLGAAQRTIEAGVHEQWSAPGTVQGQQWVGLHFIDLSDEDENALRQWLAVGADGDA